MKVLALGTMVHLAPRPTVGPGRMKELEFGFLPLEEIWECRWGIELQPEINPEPLWKDSITS